MANNQSVRRHLDAFTRGRIIGKLEEGRSVTSVAAEFGISHSIVSRLWRQFQTTGTAIRSVGRHLDAFTRGRIIGKLEEGRSVTSVAAEFGISHSIVSRLWRQFQTTGTAIRVRLMV
ncbi:transposable element Tcb2 transposase [Trichonephila clavipes]|nr:transposable element Tcb2 transposase [Trichonephila clavipes]